MYFLLKWLCLVYTLTYVKADNHWSESSHSGNKLLPSRQALQETESELRYLATRGCVYEPPLFASCDKTANAALLLKLGGNELCPNLVPIPCEHSESVELEIETILRKKGFGPPPEVAPPQHRPLSTLTDAPTVLPPPIPYSRTNPRKPQHTSTIDGLTGTPKNFQQDTFIRNDHPTVNPPPQHFLIPNVARSGHLETQGHFLSPDQPMRNQIPIAPRIEPHPSQLPVRHIQNGQQFSSSFSFPNDLGIIQTESQRHSMVSRQRSFYQSDIMNQPGESVLHREPPSIPFQTMPFTLPGTPNMHQNDLNGFPTMHSRQRLNLFMASPEDTTIPLNLHHSGILSRDQPRRQQNTYGRIQNVRRDSENFGYINGISRGDQRRELRYNEPFNNQFRNPRYTHTPHFDNGIPLTDAFPNDYHGMQFQHAPLILGERRQPQQISFFNNHRQQYLNTFSHNEQEEPLTSLNLNWREELPNAVAFNNLRLQPVNARPSDNQGRQPLYASQNDGHRRRMPLHENLERQLTSISNKDALKRQYSSTLSNNNQEDTLTRSHLNESQGEDDRERQILNVPTDNHQIESSTRAHLNENQEKLFSHDPTLDNRLRQNLNTSQSENEGRHLTNTTYIENKERKSQVSSPITNLPSKSSFEEKPKAMSSNSSDNDHQKTLSRNMLGNVHQEMHSSSFILNDKSRRISSNSSPNSGHKSYSTYIQPDGNEKQRRTPSNTHSNDITEKQKSDEKLETSSINKLTSNVSLSKNINDDGLTETIDTPVDVNKTIEKNTIILDSFETDRHGFRKSEALSINTGIRKPANELDTHSVKFKKSDKTETESNDANVNAIKMNLFTDNADDASEPTSHTSDDQTTPITEKFNFIKLL